MRGPAAGVPCCCEASAAGSYERTSLLVGPGTWVPGSRSSRATVKKKINNGRGLAHSHSHARIGTSKPCDDSIRTHWYTIINHGIAGVDDKIRLFRPNLNAARLSKSCARLALPTFDQSELLSLISTLVSLFLQAIYSFNQIIPRKAFMPSKHCAW